MIRKMTANEKYFLSDYDYVFEDYSSIFESSRIVMWLTESQFRQLAFESISLLDNLLKEKWQEYFEKMKCDDELTDDEFEKKHWKSRD